MVVGVNYPWRRYGGDFGPTVWGTHHGVAAERDAIATDLRAIAALGIETVRWFVFTDARGGLAIDRHGRPAGLLDGTLDDLDAWLEAALAAGISVVPVLFDHTLVFTATDADGARVGGHHAWLADPDSQQRLTDTVIAPLADRYGAGGSHAALGRAVHAWDLLNEPDWIIAEHHPSRRLRAPIRFDVVAQWVAGAVAVLRAHQCGRVTIGGARLRFAHWWDDDAIGLDFLQAHAYYDPAHDHDLRLTPYAALGLRRPLVIGECSAAGDSADEPRGRTAQTATDLAEAAVRLGYAGAWPWSWRGVDAHGSLAPREAAQLGRLGAGHRPGGRAKT